LGIGDWGLGIGDWAQSPLYILYINMNLNKYYLIIILDLKLKTN
jgi:hypothetical protein